MTIPRSQSSNDLVIRSDGPFYQIHEAGPLAEGANTCRPPSTHLGHGIPGAMAASLAFLTDDTRMSFVRAARKDSGLELRIEGAVTEDEYAGSCHWGTRDEDLPAGAALVTVEDGPLTNRGLRQISGLQLQAPALRFDREFPDDDLSFDDAILTHRGDYRTTMGAPVTEFYDTIPGISQVETVIRIARRLGSAQDQFDAVIAPAFGGIPLAIAVAAVLDLPCLIVNLKSDRLEAYLDPISFVPQNSLVVDDFISVGSRFSMLQKLFSRIGTADATYAAVAGFADSPQVGSHPLRLAFTLPERGSRTAASQTAAQ